MVLDVAFDHALNGYIVVVNIASSSDTTEWVHVRVSSGKVGPAPDKWARPSGLARLRCETGYQIGFKHSGVSKKSPNTAASKVFVPFTESLPLLRPNITPRSPDNVTRKRRFIPLTE